MLPAEASRVLRPVRTQVWRMTSRQLIQVRPSHLRAPLHPRFSRVLRLSFSASPPQILARSPRYRLQSKGALGNFVLGGGTALIFADNSTFASNAPAANASLLNPFGVTITGTLNGGQTAPIINPTGPLTSPYPVTAFFGNYTGYFNGIGQGTVLANFGPGEPAIDYFAPHVLGPHSGAVVLFADSDAMVAGDALTSSNLNLILNAFATYQLSVPEPSSSTLMLVGFAGVGLAVYMMKRWRSVICRLTQRPNPVRQRGRLPATGYPVPRFAAP